MRGKTVELLITVLRGVCGTAGVYMTLVGVSH